MVETAILLPLILVAIFVAIGLSVIANGRSALSSGMSEAIRLAATRGDPTLMGGQQMIAPMKAYLEDYDLEQLRPLLTSGDISEGDYKSFLDKCFGRIHGTNSLQDLPPQYAYALIYINQALRQSIGPSLKFPCIPPGGSPPGGVNSCPTTREPGCVSCYLINPNNFTFASLSTADPNRYAIRCEYSPSNIILDPIYKLFGLFSAQSSSSGGGLVIKRDRLFDITRLGG